MLYPSFAVPRFGEEVARHRNPIGIAANSTVTTTANTRPHGSTSPLGPGASPPLPLGLPLDVSAI
jgi:hypothetical protein